MIEYGSNDYMLGGRWARGVIFESIQFKFASDAREACAVMSSLGSRSGPGPGGPRSSPGRQVHGYALRRPSTQRIRKSNHICIHMCFVFEGCNPAPSPAHPSHTNQNPEAWLAPAAMPPIPKSFKQSLICGSTTSEKCTKIRSAISKRFSLTRFT